LLPDALEAVFIKEEITEGKNEALDQLISDYGSGLYGTFFSTGQILAPIVGSAVYEAIDYRPTTDVMTAVCLLWCLVFFSFNVGFGIFKNEKEIHEKLKKAQDALMLTKDDYDADITNEEGSPKIQVVEGDAF
jgi:hypothetical protein